MTRSLFLLLVPTLLLAQTLTRVTGNLATITGSTHTWSATTVEVTLTNCSIAPPVKLRLVPATNGDVDFRVPALSSFSCGSGIYMLVVKDNGTTFFQQAAHLSGTAWDWNTNLPPVITSTDPPPAKSLVGLAHVDDTSDLAKPISTATQSALDLKVSISTPILTGVPAFQGTNSTGTTVYVPGGSNCPATTCTTPYTWIRIKTSDGSTAYIPVFK